MCDLQLHSLVFRSRANSPQLMGSLITLMIIADIFGYIFMACTSNFKGVYFDDEKIAKDTHHHQHSLSFRKSANT